MSRTDPYSEERQEEGVIPGGEWLLFQAVLWTVLGVLMLVLR